MVQMVEETLEVVVAKAVSTQAREALVLVWASVPALELGKVQAAMSVLVWT